MHINIYVYVCMLQHTLQHRQQHAMQHTHKVTAECNTHDSDERQNTARNPWEREQKATVAFQKRENRYYATHSTHSFWASMIFLRRFRWPMVRGSAVILNVNVSWHIYGSESWHTCGWVMAHMWMGYYAHTWYFEAAPLSCMWMRHGTHMRANQGTHVDESWHTCGWVMTHTCGWVKTHMCMSHDTRTWCFGAAPLSCTWMRHGTYMRVNHGTHVDESWHTHVDKSWHTHMNLRGNAVILHVNESWHIHGSESWHTYGRVMTHTWRWVMAHIHDASGSAIMLHVNESHHSYGIESCSCTRKDCLTKKGKFVSAFPVNRLLLYQAVGTA